YQLTLTVESEPRRFRGSRIIDAVQHALGQTGLGHNVGVDLMMQVDGVGRLTRFAWCGFNTHVQAALLDREGLKPAAVVSVLGSPHVYTIKLFLLNEPIADPTAVNLALA